MEQERLVIVYSIGSGDVNILLTKNKKTKSYHTFIKKFFGIEHTIYNAYNSPIDQLRIGQITEDRYCSYLGFEWYTQVKTINPECEVLVSTLDFAKIRMNKVIEFQEVKSINFNDFVLLNDDFNCKKSKRTVYNQIQHQLYTSKLKEATLTFICVYNYDDEENLNRVIEERDIKKYAIERDEEVIAEIAKAAEPFEIWRKGANL